MTPQHAAPVHAAGAVATTDAIRQQFPALAREHRGRHVAYFDGPGGTQVPRQVTEAMTDYLLHHNANTHWDYPSSHETDAAIEAARQAAADLLNASPAEIVFGQNMTTLTLHLARALGRGWGPGDELIVTELDHHANVDTWRTLEAERGVTVRMAPMDAATGTLVWSDLERLVSTRTRLLAIGAASNALGTINDLARAASAAKAAGALLFVDAVHYAAHASIDVQAIGCDFLACSAYKFYGPHVGLLYGRRALVESLPVAKLDPAPDTAPERLETGTQNHEGIVGLRAAIDFLASLGPAPTRRASLVGVMHELDRRGQVLLARLWDGLSRIPAVTLFGQPPGEARTPTLSFVVAGHPSADVARRLADSAVFVSHGDFYATTLVRRLGHAQDGVVRLGCACYTTEEEIERVLAAVAALAP